MGYARVRRDTQGEMCGICKGCEQAVKGCRQAMQGDVNKLSKGCRQMRMQGKQMTAPKNKSPVKIAPEGQTGGTDIDVETQWMPEEKANTLALGETTYCA